MAKRFNLHIENKYAYSIIQILLFIFILFPMIYDLGNIFILILFLILEAISFALLILKKDFKYTVEIWISQFYLIFLLELLIRPTLFFQVDEISSKGVLIFIVLASLIEITISLLVFFGERMVKPVLIGLSSSTTLIVFIMVFFIAQQGLATFEETNPIDFLTGTAWNAYYEEPYFQDLNITVIQKNYDFKISSEDNNIFISPNHSFSVPIIISNTGGKQDQYTLSIESPNQIIWNLEKYSLSLEPHETKTINLTIQTKTFGDFNVQCFCKSVETNDIKNINLSISSQQYAFQLTPKSVSLYPKRHDLISATASFRLINSGVSSDTYTISVVADSIFRPFIREINNWNYSTASGTISLESLESVNLSINPKMINEIYGEYNITIRVTSNNSSIEKIRHIYFEYDYNEIFNVDNTRKILSENDTVTFFFSTSERLSFDLIVNDIPDGWSSIIIQNDTTILSGAGSTNISIIESENAFQMIVSADEFLDGNIEQLTIRMGNKGSSPSYGILLFITASAVTTLIAVAVAGPLGLFIAVFLAEFCPKRFRHVLRSLYDLLAGIPSVVYGFWGFFTLSPLFGNQVFPFLFGMNISSGRSLLTASFILIFMILPIVIALSHDSIESVEKKLKNGSLALGATRWQTMRYIIIPKAKSGIIASVILATGRAIGETMAVLMITGGSSNAVLALPDFLFSRTNTLTTIIAQVFPWGIEQERTQYALFAISFFLFVIIFILNILIYFLQREKKITFFSRFYQFFKLQKIKKRLSRNNGETDKKFQIIQQNYHKASTKKKFKIIDETFKTNFTNISYKRKSKIDKNIILNTTKKALLHEKIVTIILYIFALMVTGFLFFIIGEIIIKGSLSFKLSYLTETETFLGGGYGGGFANALVGSLQLVGLALIVAVPLSIGAAIYITEYAKRDNIFTKIIMFTSDTLASTPSIVYGAFGFMFLIAVLEFDKSLFAGGITLGIMVIPLLLRSSIEAIKSVPHSFREGSYALGITKWQTIKNVVLPPSSPGISSGLIISIGRAIGETAAIIFTAGYTSHIASSILHPVASLPNMIYSFYSKGGKFPILKEKLFSVAFLLIVIILILNLIAKYIAHRSARMMKE